MCYVLLWCSTWAGCLCSGVEQNLAGAGRDDELGSVRMTNAAAALPRLDCPSESHRKEGADQNRKFRVRDSRGHRARWPGRRGGGRDHLVSMAATRTGSFALFTCDSIFSSRSLVSQGRQTFFSPQPWKAGLCYSPTKKSNSLPTHALRAMPTWGMPWRCCFAMLV